jgi:hypothetical protein
MPTGLFAAPPGGSNSTTDAFQPRGCGSDRIQYRRPFNLTSRIKAVAGLQICVVPDGYGHNSSMGSILGHPLF